MNAGCTPMLFQFVILFGLIGAIYYPLSHFLTGITDDEIKILSAAVAKIDSSKFANSTHLAELLIIQNIDKLQGLPGVSQATYEAIASVNFDFFDLFSLGDIPMGHKFPHVIWIIPVLSFLSSFATGLYSQMKQKKQNPTMANNPMMGCMTLFMPLFSLYFVVNYPAGIGIYWIISSVMQIVQQFIITKFFEGKEDDFVVKLPEKNRKNSKKHR